MYAVIDVANNGNLLMYSKASKTVPARQFMLTFDDCIISCGGTPTFSGMSTTVTQFIAGVRDPNGARLAGGSISARSIPCSGRCA